MDKLIKYLFVMMISFLSKEVKANISLPKIIGDNMVFQRNKPVAVWGTASANERIIVSFKGQTKHTTTNAKGNWSVMLDAMSADAKSAAMVIKGNNTVTLENILVGEVWLCSGQSNMQYTMTKQTNFAHAKRSTGLDSAALSKENNPNIRLFLVVRDLTKPDGGNVNKGWNAATGAPLGAFSAVGYFFSKELYEQLNIPIGMIASSVSGSNIDPWLNGEVFETTGADIKWKIDANSPGKFHRGMIEPLAPFTLQGFLWYQGETNSFLNEKEVYAYKFKHMINTWRNLWHDKEAPFYFVQIAPFYYSKNSGKVPLTPQSLPEFRQAQTAALSLPNTGMVVTTDLVDDPKDLHPTYKWVIGRRLARLALANEYGKPLEACGPAFRAMEQKGDQVIISFDHKGKGLASNNGQSLTGFEIAGEDGRFVAAKAVIENDHVIVSAPGVERPMHVRFAWQEDAQPNFYNKDGLPAVPFNTAYSLDLASQ